MERSRGFGLRRLRQGAGFRQQGLPLTPPHPAPRESQHPRPPPSARRHHPPPPTRPRRHLQPVTSVFRVMLGPPVKWVLVTSVLVPSLRVTSVPPVAWQ